MIVHLNRDMVERAVSDPALREVLAMTISSAKSVKEISDGTGIPLSSTYRHVESLQRAGLLIVDRSAISPEGKRYDLFRSRLRRAMIEVSRAGVQVTWDIDETVEDRLARMWRQMRL